MTFNGVDPLDRFVFDIRGEQGPLFSSFLWSRVSGSHWVEIAQGGLCLGLIVVTSELYVEPDGSGLL